jgi:hypothetical protein
MPEELDARRTGVMNATKKLETQLALWARLVAVARVAMGWISEAKSFTPSAHAERGTDG